MENPSLTVDGETYELPQLVIYAIPFFLLSIFVEMGIGAYRKKDWFW